MAFFFFTFVTRLYIVPCIFKPHAEYIRQNAGLDEAQAGIRSAGRNFNNFRYTDDTTLMAETEEEWKSLSMRVTEESKKLTWHNIKN